MSAARFALTACSCSLRATSVLGVVYFFRTHYILILSTLGKTQKSKLAILIRVAFRRHNFALAELSPPAGAWYGRTDSAVLIASPCTVI